MANIDWQPLPPLWPSPAVWTDVGDFMLLIFTEDNVPTWEVRRKVKRVDGHDDERRSVRSQASRIASVDRAPGSRSRCHRRWRLSRHASSIA